MTQTKSIHTASADKIDENIDLSQTTNTHATAYDADLTFSAAQEARAVWKVDILLLPFIVLCFCFLQFDRTNIGNALSDTLARDIHVTNSDVNLSQTLFTAGFVITELPFNMISKYIGPQRFLPVTMFLWGTATWAQVFLKSAAGLYAARFFIGALEGGFIPGFVLYISRYYTNKELGLRYAIFWASNAFAGMLGGPLAVGLLSLKGRGGLHGWQWLFLIGESPSNMRLSNTFVLIKMNRRRNYQCFGSRCILLSPVFTNPSQNLIWQIYALLQRRSGCYNHHASSSRRPDQIFAVRKACFTFACAGHIQGLAPIRSYCRRLLVHDHDCASQYLCPVDNQVTWVHHTTG